MTLVLYLLDFLLSLMEELLPSLLVGDGCLLGGGMGGRLRLGGGGGGLLALDGVGGLLALDGAGGFPLFGGGLALLDGGGGGPEQRGERA